jgi:hypothetical protein
MALANRGLLTLTVARRVVGHGCGGRMGCRRALDGNGSLGRGRGLRRNLMSDDDSRDRRRSI